MRDTMHSLSPEDKFIAYYTYGPSSTINKYRRVDSITEKEEVIEEAVQKILEGEPGLGYGFYKEYYGGSVVRNWAAEQWKYRLTKDIKNGYVKNHLC